MEKYNASNQLPNSTKNYKLKENKIPGKNVFKVKDNYFVLDERYEYIKCIGLGSYGVVISAFDNITKTKVAIKKVPKAFEDLIDAKRIVREIKILRYFNHFNMVKLLDIPKPPSKLNYDDIYIITDLMETDLHKIIYSKQQISDEHIKYFSYQMLRGVLYMHSCGIIHRDIKPSNILLNKNCDLKICDLGLARAYDNDEEGFLTEYVVTRWYRAPEVILNSKRYDEKLDVWGIACVIAEILGRAPLLPGNDYLEQIHKIVQLTGTPNASDLEFIKNEPAKKYINRLPKFKRRSLMRLFPKTNGNLINLLEGMLAFNPQKRLSVRQALEHPYFQDIYHYDDLVCSKTKFDWGFDKDLTTKEALQTAVWDESLHFHPEHVQKENNTFPDIYNFSPTNEDRKRTHKFSEINHSKPRKEDQRKHSEPAQSNIKQSVEYQGNGKILSSKNKVVVIKKKQNKKNLVNTYNAYKNYEVI